MKLAVMPDKMSFSSNVNSRLFIGAPRPTMPRSESSTMNKSAV